MVVGGQDTISLHCASLKPDTIHTLMLVKQHLAWLAQPYGTFLGTEHLHVAVFTC